MLITELELLINKQDDQRYFRVYRCHDCGRYVRYKYGDTFCKACFYRHDHPDLIGKRDVYYDPILIDGLTYARNEKGVR